MPIQSDPPGLFTFSPATSSTPRSLWMAAFTLTAFLGVSPAHAGANEGAAIAQKGASGAPACMACHGANGEGQAAAGFPRLAGQPPAYLLKQLKELAAGQRKSAQMEPIARALSEKQMQDVAAYYGSLPQWQPKKGGAETKQGDATSAQTPTPNSVGYNLANRGNWAKGVPACFACHGEGGVGVAPHFPALAGQPASYTRMQLEAWKTGKRENDPQGLMKSVAMRLSEAEVAAVSDYFENPNRDGKDK